MKNFVVLILVIAALLGTLAFATGYFGRDIISNLRQVLDKQSLAQDKTGKVISQFAVMSDTHSDNAYTQKAVDLAKSLGANFLIHVGDWTTVGTIAELEKQKAIFEKSGLEYWGVMGDHDRWQSQAKNFRMVIGKIYQSFDKDKIHFILLDSSDINKGLGKEQLDWFEKDVRDNQNKPIIIFSHLPVYHPTSDRTISAKAGEDAKRDQDSKRFLDIIKGKKIIAMFSGDHHLSETYTEPTTGVKIVIVGAVTRQRNLQTPRFDLVKIYENNEITVKEEEILN